MACEEGASKSGIEPDEILSDELYGVLIQASGEAKPLSPTVIAGKLRAAEDSIARELALILGAEKRIVSAPDLRPELTADDWDLEEPAYDYPDDFFVDHRHGLLQLHARPVVKIDRVFLGWPGSPPAELFNFTAWTRIDKKFGRFQLVPPASGGNLSTAALSGFLASLVGGGRGIPHALYVDYTAGLSLRTLRDEHADLLEAIKIRTTLLTFGILSNIRTRGLSSQSVSTDGLTRSQSAATGKWGPYSGAIELAMEHERMILDGWKAKERGIVFAVATG